MNRSRSIRFLICLIAFTLLPFPLMAYVGPGAGFAFISSFFTLFMVLVLAVFSLLAWPFRFVYRKLKRRRILGKSTIDKVIILGLDGMDPMLVDKYMAEGKLPHLSRLKEEGSYAPLRTTIPSISPVAWSSFMTGAHPAKHNIFDFLSRDPRTYLPDLSSASISKPKRVFSIGKYNIPISKPEIKGMRKSVPFWKILGDSNIFSTILRVPITFPPEKFNGHLLSGMCAPDLKGSQGTFFFYTTDLEKVKEHEGGVILPVDVKDGQVDTFISGPENTMLKKVEEIRLPLKIRLDREKDEAHITVSGQTFCLKKGVFSEWKKLSFHPGLGLTISSTARFYVSQIHPHFEMYLTPLNIDPEKPALPISHPSFYSIYLSKLLGSFITLGEANDTWALNEGALSEEAFLELTYSNHREWEGMFFNAIDKTQRGVAACVFETTDSIQHMFFRYLDPAHPALKNGQCALSAKVIEDLYANMDELVGKTQSRLDDKTVLIVMSDHGFKSFRRGVNINSWLYVNGYLSLKDGMTESGEWFKDVDWERTKAYAIGLGGLYLNQVGREAQGIVEAGEEAKVLRNELIEKLTLLYDDERGEKAMSKVYDKDDLPGGPYKENAPDLIIGYNIGYRASWDGVKGKVNRIVIEDNIKAWSGDHCIDPALVPGIFFSNRKINKKNPCIVDIAPTVLTLFGLKPPPHMDGDALMES